VGARAEAGGSSRSPFSGCSTHSDCDLLRFPPLSAVVIFLAASALGGQEGEVVVAAAEATEAAEAEAAVGDGKAEGQGAGAESLFCHHLRPSMTFRCVAWSV